LLAAEITLDLGIILAIAGPFAAIGGTIAVMKWRQNALEDKQKEASTSSKEGNEKLEKVDERIFQDIKDLGKTMQRRFDQQDKRQAGAEKSMIGKIDGFQSKMFRRLDDVQKDVSAQDKRLSVHETEARHTREKVEKHAKKITMYGKAPLKRDE
jgi:hypothetical protein